MIPAMNSSATPTHDFDQAASDRFFARASIAAGIVGLVASLIGTALALLS
jgi:hypothetical protein